MTESRKIAYKILYKCITQNAYSNLVLSSALDESRLDGKDKALVTQLVYGTLSRKRTLDFYITQLSTKPILKLDKKVLIILDMALYQIEFMDKIPPSAACDEAVKLTKKFVNVGASGFVNAILRNFLRRREEILQIDMNNADRYSVSDDVEKLISTQYPSESESIFSAFFNSDGIFVSVNTLRITTNELEKAIDGEVVHEGLLKLTNSSVTTMSEFKNGDFFVQDYASAKAVETLSPKQGDTVMDVCAAPGGKSFKAAMLMHGKGKILSFDLHKNKLSLIKSGAERLGVDIITVNCADATIFDKKYENIADKIICDVPCSGLGVIGKKPEIRYKKINDIEQLYPIQQAILENVSKYLKVGGRMIYSTCTINKFENDKQVADFLSKNKKFKLLSEETLLPSAQNDGFYIALLEKTEG